MRERGGRAGKGGTHARGTAPRTHTRLTVIELVEGGVDRHEPELAGGDGRVQVVQDELEEARAVVLVGGAVVVGVVVRELVAEGLGLGEGAVRAVGPLHGVHGSLATRSMEKTPDKDNEGRGQVRGS